MDQKTKDKEIARMKAEGVKCGYCDMYIFKHNEVNGVVHFRKKLPICVKCRIIKGFKGRKILKAIKKALEFKKQSEQVIENKRIVEYAILTQKGMHKVKTIKNKLLK